MALLQDWLPPSPENHATLVFWWSFFPIWVVSWYGMGKTSVRSRLNLPGRAAWLTMESPGFVTLLYIMGTLPGRRGVAEEDLPWQNRVLAGLFVLHYGYRAVLFPLLQPSMSPIHAAVWASALLFQLCNAVALGGWLAAYGPVTAAAWAAPPLALPRFALGLAVFYVGLAGNYFCDEELRDIRRRELRRRRERRAREDDHGPPRPVDKHYEVPNNGLFRYLLFPHYFMEWVEWLGFWIAAGFDCAPARCFLLNEFFSMWPRAVAGAAWYRRQFGADKIKGKYVVIPGVW